MHVFRVLAALVLGAVVGELGIGPAVDALGSLGGRYPALGAVILVPCLVGAAATAVALLVLPVKATK